MADENTFPNLIREYAEKGEIQNIVTLLESMKSQRDRAERKLELYIHMNEELKVRFANITEPATGRKVTDSAPMTTVQPREKLRTVKPKEPKPGLDVSDFAF